MRPLPLRLVVREQPYFSVCQPGNTFGAMNKSSQWHLGEVGFPFITAPLKKMPQIGTCTCKLGKGLMEPTCSTQTHCCKAGVGDPAATVPVWGSGRQSPKAQVLPENPGSSESPAAWGPGVTSREKKRVSEAEPMSGFTQGPPRSGAC